MLCMAAKKTKVVQSAGALGALVLLTLVHGLSLAPYSYLISQLFKSPTTAKRFFFIVLLVLPVVAMFATLSTDQFAPFTTYVPIWPYSVQAARLFIESLTETGWSTAEEIKKFNLSSHMITYAISFLANTVAALLVDHLRTDIYPVPGQKQPSPNAYQAQRDEEVDEDDDVRRERAAAETSQPATFPLLWRRVTKTFRKGTRPAVDNVSLGLGQNTCFGLLGPNGAGKSTLTNLAVGELRASSGAVFVSGRAMAVSCAAVFRGADAALCMQSDTALMCMTARQHLLLLHEMRCACSRREARADVARVLAEVELTRYADQPVGTLSGGNLRKLSVAAALLPKTRVLLLDEPSTGMDPVARRKVWDAVAHKKRGCCVLLTTHSREEAERVCDTIGIMAHGQLQCVGSIQHLRNKFNRNYHLHVQLDNAGLQPSLSGDVSGDAVGEDPLAPLIEQLVSGDEPSSATTSTTKKGGWKVVEAVGAKRTYELADVLRMSRVFEVLEARKREFHVASYSLTQASLDDIFLQLVRREEAKLEQSAAQQEQEQQKCTKA